MWLYVINFLCWNVTFVCFYFLLNPNTKLIHNKNVSPFKKSISKDLKESFNIIKILKNFHKDKIIKISSKFHNNFNVVICNFNGSLNVGNIMRLACIYGCKNYYIIGRKIYDTRSCVGANRYLNVHFVKNIITSLPDKSEIPKFDYKKFRKFLLNNNIAPIFIEQGGNNISNFSFKKYHNNIPKKLIPTFIFGNETFGIDNNLIKYCKDLPGCQILTIPQVGVLQSLNVSNSASIILWEYYKQVLEKKNVYEKYNLIESEFCTK